MDCKDAIALVVMVVISGCATMWVEAASPKPPLSTSSLSLQSLRG